MVGRVQLSQRKYEAAEATLRDLLGHYEKASPESWNLYSYQSLLGASLAGQKKFVEAEPLLLSGYDGMRQREATTARLNRADLVEAGNRIVELYEGWGQRDKAAEWRQKLQATTRGTTADRR